MQAVCMHIGRVPKAKNNVLIDKSIVTTLKIMCGFVIFRIHSLKAMKNVQMFYIVMY